jgi:signal transduction histidine kinase
MTIPTEEPPEERDLLRAAFRSFDQAAKTLQVSYDALTERVNQMDLELARSNDALRQQLSVNEAMRAHLDGILESLSSGVLVVNEEDVITRSNRAAALLLHETGEALRGRSATEVLASAGLCVLERPQRLGQAMVSITQTTLQTESQGVSGRLILIQDVTRLYQLEEQLQRKDRLAAMGELIGRIAHEIRNPLGSVELFASLLRRDLTEHLSAKGYAEQISQAVQSMDRLLANLLTYTRPARADHGWHSAEPLIMDSLALAAHAINKVPVDIRVHLDPGISALWCHEGQLKQVLLNLIVNAVQAMPNGGTLTIILETVSPDLLGVPAVRLTVSDSGVGIDPVHRSRIFDPFFTTKDEGTGLGLAIVYSIIEAHQGRIDVESTQGRGTSCALVLPHPIAALGQEQTRGSATGLGAAPLGACPEHELVLAEEWSHE